MKADFFARRALLILCVLFFLVPFAMRGARMSWERMETNVKDWLPDTFEETKDLAWFGEHFASEQASVLLTWEGCSEQDESYQLFVQKLRNEIKPKDEPLIGGAQGERSVPDAGNETDAGNKIDAGNETGGAGSQEQRARELARGRELGDELGLYAAGDDTDYFNWGGLQEKWLRGAGGSWYYITPKGELFRWQGGSNILSVLHRLFQRKVLGNISLDGTLVEQLGQPPTSRRTNGFHDDPQRLAARVLRSVTTGPEMLAVMSAPGGSLSPAGDDSEETRAQIARRHALDRLEGTFFGPEPYAQFVWTADDLPRVVREATLRQLPKDWRKTVEAFVANLLRTQYEGERSELVAESLLKKEEHWNAMFAELGVEPPGLQTCILVTLSDPGMHDLDCVIGRGMFGRPRGKLVDLAVESGVLAPPKPPVFPLVRHVSADGRVLRMGGPAADNMAFDEEGQITLVRLVGSLAVLGIALGYFCFRRITAVLMILMVSIVSALASLAIVWWTDSRVDAVLWLMPLLIFVLGMAGAIYLINYYRETSSERGVEGAPSRALAQAAAPCILAAVTMAAGLFALCTSANYPIRKFGFFSALGVLATLVVLFTFLPSALQLWPLKYEGQRTPAASGKLARLVRWSWQTIGNLAVDHNWWVAASALALMIALGLNLGQLKTSVQPLSLFGQNTKIIRDYEWLEANVGKPVPMELVIAVDKKWQYPTAQERAVMPPLSPEEDAQQNYQYNFLERIELVAHVQNAIDKVFGPEGQDLLGPGLSAATFAPPVLDPLDAQRAVTSSALEQQRDPLRQQGYLALTDEGTELWRINMRLSALSNVDYGRFVTELKQVVEPVLKAYEFRDEILRKVAEQHQDVADASARWSDTKIAILGASDPRDEADDITAMVELPEIRPAGQPLSDGDMLENENRTLGVHREFAKVLSDLLRAKGYQGKKGGRAPGQYLVWQDPRRNPLKDNYARSEGWAKQLASFDCVVVLRDHAGYDVDFIRQHAKCFVDARQHCFDPVHGQTARQLDKPLEVTYTGMVPILHRAQQTLLQSLIDSVWWAFVAIAVVMMIAVRTRQMQLPHVLGGLAAMIPALFTVIVIFGEFGRRGLMVDIGTLMTAGVAMGVTVVGTYQFLIWFRRAVQTGLERRAAIKMAYSRGSVSILQTTVIAGLGLTLFALGTFVPTQRFGITMLALLLAALVANLVLLPALLAGPLGRYLSPRMPAVATVDGIAPTSRDARTPSSLESSNAVPAGSMHSPPREGRTPTMVRRDSSHS